jgi:hypothetical protein
MPRGGWNRGRAKVAGSGRKRGTPNRSTAAVQHLIVQMKLDCSDPLSFCISILRNEDAPYEERKWAAAQLFPYTHPRLSSIEARQSFATHEQRLEEARRMLEDLDRSED